jgi:hypothetical protein
LAAKALTYFSRSLLVVGGSFASRRYNPRMSPVLIFLAIFVGVLLVCAAAYPVGIGLNKLSRWLERRTGNYTLAYAVPPMVFVALMMAACLTWIIVKAPVVGK